MQARLEILARLYARPGQESALAALLVAHAAEVRLTAGCLAIHDHVSIRDPQLFYIHSRWQSEAAFESYARLISTDHFIEEVGERMENAPLRAMRATALEAADVEALSGGDLYVFATLHAGAAEEGGVEQALRAVHDPTAREAGCVAHQIYRSLRDRGLYYVHSVWKEAAAFERHISLPHTVQFVERIEGLIDHPLEVARTRQIA